jgi:haloacetate dehalogenase
LTPFDPRAIEEYARCLAIPGAAHGLCEDYRASAGIDLIHDRTDIENQNNLKIPLLILWGRDGVVNQCFKPLEEWQKVAINVQGHALPCGHYIAEEAPELLLKYVQDFFARSH